MIQWLPDRGGETTTIRICNDSKVLVALAAFANLRRIVVDVDSLNKVRRSLAA